VLQRTYEGQECSIARTLEIVGERWSMLVIRDIFRGRRRFDQLQQGLGIARNVLSARLDLLVEEGILERRRYQDRPARYEYRLTERGIELWPVLMHLLMWGDRHLAEGCPPGFIEHEGCGGNPTRQLTCDRCGEQLHARNVCEVPAAQAAVAA
jgi:DNA-binding HxlR family transcriptional regulator